MGPNQKKRTRKQYIKYRLRVLDELCIAPPTTQQLEHMMDESTSEIEVDSIFLSCIQRAER